MTFPLEFDLLMIGVCTFIQNKNGLKKSALKKKQNKRKKKQKKSEKICLCLISYSIDFFLLGSSVGFESEFFL